MNSRLPTLLLNGDLQPDRVRGASREALRRVVTDSAACGASVSALAGRL